MHMHACVANVASYIAAYVEKHKGFAVFMDFVYVTSKIKIPSHDQSLSKWPSLKTYLQKTSR